MNRPVLIAAVLAASAAFAQRDRSEMEGRVYAAIGGGGSLLMKPGDSTLGYDLEVRAGYSFIPKLQVYVAGALDGGSFSGATFRTEQIVAFGQYHLWVESALMAYLRAGVGVALSPDVVPGSLAWGLGAASGLGVEIQVAPNVFLAPEFFYRYSNPSTGGTGLSVHTIGMQLGLVYY